MGEGEWVRTGELQHQAGGSGGGAAGGRQSVLDQLRLRDALLEDMEDPEKQRLLHERRRAQAAAKAELDKLEELRARRLVDDESRKLADDVMCRDEAYVRGVPVLCCAVRACFVFLVGRSVGRLGQFAG